MKFVTKNEFLNIKVKEINKTISDCLDLLSEEDSNENKLKITTNILETLKENKLTLVVSSYEILDKIVNLHNSLNEINSFSDYWTNEKTRKTKLVKDYMIY